MRSIWALGNNGGERAYPERHRGVEGSVKQSVVMVVLWGLPYRVEDVLGVGDVEATHANLGELDPGCAICAFA